MKDLSYFDVAPTLLRQMSQGGGVFFTVKSSDGRENTMTVGWGSVSWYWNRPIFVAPIRHARYTYELLQTTNEFTISVPSFGTLHPALSLVGTRSGSEMDKFDAAGLTRLPALEVAAPIIAQCPIHLECKIGLITEMDKSQMSQEVLTRCYGDNDMHTLYFGQVLRCYTTQE